VFTHTSTGACQSSGAPRWQLRFKHSKASPQRQKREHGEAQQPVGNGEAMPVHQVHLQRPGWWCSTAQRVCFVFGLLHHCQTPVRDQAAAAQATAQHSAAEGLALGRPRMQRRVSSDEPMLSNSLVGTWGAPLEAHTGSFRQGVHTHVDCSSGVHQFTTTVTAPPVTPATRLRSRRVQTSARSHSAAGLGRQAGVLLCAPQPANLRELPVPWLQGPECRDAGLQAGGFNSPLYSPHTYLGTRDVANKYRRGCEHVACCKRPAGAACQTDHSGAQAS
jgi:hypothetical protein